MNKTLSALAVAAAFGATSANAMEFEPMGAGDTNFAIEGALEYVYTDTDTGSDSVTEFADNGSAIAFLGDSRFDNGMTGYFHIEYEFQADENQGGIDTLDSAYLGVEGNFGDVRIGKWDGFYDDYVDDHHDVFATVDSSNPDDSTVEDAIGYATPSINGFTAGGLVIIKGDGDDDAPNGDSEQGIQLFAEYATDMFTVGVGYDDKGAEAPDHDGVYGAAGTVHLGALNLTARAEFEGESDDNADDGADYLGLLASYDYGMGDLHAMVNQVSEDADNVDDRTEIVLGTTYNVSDNMFVWLEAQFQDRDNDQGDQTAIGVAYGF